MAVTHAGSGEASRAEVGEERHERAWRRRLLPVMVTMLGALTVFFFAASFFQLFYLHQRIEQVPPLPIMGGSPQDIAMGSADPDVLRWRALIALEGHALQRRYHQANVSLMARVWTKYLGFVTGMILALVGAAFILGRLREPQSTLNVDSGVVKLALIASSPGLVLAVLGTGLMITAMLTHTDIDVRDGAIYTHAPAPMPAPAPFPVPGAAPAVGGPAPAGPASTSLPDPGAALRQKLGNPPAAPGASPSK